MPELRYILKSKFDLGLRVFNMYLIRRARPI